ncbi:MAG TPA: polysaccharide biosynthesis/export family protein [Kofleriaceae bacterium]|nr:polysaccharide biosynthesis/export family protein [Kofleriaceae bacterium]
MRALLVLWFVVLAGCPKPVPFHDYAKEPDPRTKELVLGVGDVVAVNVWENKEFNTEATIRPDGTITMPLIGDLKAAGETPTSLKRQIKTQLADYVKSTPGTELVTIAVKAWRSYKFTIEGEVGRPGVYTSDGFVTVADALAMAGGVSRFAKQSEIKIFRVDPESKKIRTIPVDYGKITSGKRLDMNIWLLAGDTISVP